MMGRYQAARLVRQVLPSKPWPNNGDMAPLIKAATNAVSRWRYEPTRVDGRPVGTTAQIHVNFRLRKPALVSGK
jgi:hypothetical protein